jgi:peptidoglycan hydrolase CwlO-like protein
MKKEDKHIEEIRKIRSEICAELEGLSLDEQLERINQGAMDFQKQVDQAKKEQKPKRTVVVEKKEEVVLQPI